jgi:hypothetical protein
VEALTKDQIQMAAQTSYAYWHLERTQQLPPGGEDEFQMKLAMREARRHLASVAGNFHKALSRLQEASDYRRDHNLERLRTCFSNNNIETKNDDVAAGDGRLRLQLAGDLEKQHVVMRGQDRQSRAILIKFARTMEGTTQDAYLGTQLYIAERALAVGEFTSRGQQEQIVAVFDMSKQQSKHSPPMSWQLSAVLRLQQLYPERLGKLIVLDPPFFMRGLFHGIKPFLSATTKNKIQLVSSQEKEKRIQELVEKDHAIPLLLPEGKLTALFDLEHYLNDTPFYSPYDYHPKVVVQQLNY